MRLRNGEILLEERREENWKKEISLKVLREN